LNLIRVDRRVVRGLMRRGVGKIANGKNDDHEQGDDAQGNKQ
jgi:hypothetical protein